MGKVGRTAVILGIVALAWLLRARAVQMLPVDYDEDDYLRAAQDMAEVIRAGEWGDLRELNLRPVHPPLAKLMFGLAIARLPPVEKVPDRPYLPGPAASLPQPHLDVARYSAALLGTLEVLLLAILNPLGAFFLAIHTWTIKYTSQVMLEALPAFTSAAAVMSYERARICDVSERKWGWLLLSAVFLGLTAAAKYVYALAGIAILIHWAWVCISGTSGRGRRLLRWLGQALAWGLLSIALFFLFNPYLWPDPVNRLADSIFGNVLFSRSTYVQEAGLPPYQAFIWLIQSVPWHPGVFLLPLDFLIFVLTILGLRRLWRDWLLYAIWLFTAFVFLFLWPTKWPQYVLVLTFPLCLSAALGFTAVIWEPLRSWWERRATRS
jgi:hypothetical protein